ncbi:MAG: hypothetical protein ABFD97_19555 [Syntrophobacter sp.]
MPSPNVKTVSVDGVPAGSILEGAGPSNKGLIIKVGRSQPKGYTGWVKGSLKVLQAGGPYKSELEKYVTDEDFTAEEIIYEVAPRFGKKNLMIFNCNMLRLKE